MQWHGIENGMKAAQKPGKVPRDRHKSGTKGASDMKREILTVEEAAAFLQISKRSLYKLVKEGKIPGKKILNKWRFERESLRRWVSG